MKYEVKIIRTITKTATIEVDAKDEDDATTKAEKFIAKDKEKKVPSIDWDLENEDIDYEDVNCLEDEDEEES